MMVLNWTMAMHAGISPPAKAQSYTMIMQPPTHSPLHDCEPPSQPACQSRHVRADAGVHGQGPVLHDHAIVDLRPPYVGRWPSWPLHSCLSGMGRAS